MAWISNTWFGWVGSGLLIGFAAVFPIVWPLGLLGVGWFFAILFTKQTVWELLLGAWLSWTVKAACAMWWVLSVYPMDWIANSLSKTGQLGVVVLSWTASSLAIGLGGVFLASLFLLFRKSLTSVSVVFVAFVLSVFWLAGETFGSFMYSVLSIGPGGGVNIALSFGYGGYLLANHQLLLSFATVAGVYGLSFLFAALGQLLWQLVCHDVYRLYALCFLFVLYMTSFVPVTAGQINEGQKVAVIETTFENRFMQEKGRVFEMKQALETAVAAALKNDSAYILLPEGAGYFDQTTSVATTKTKFELTHESPAVVLVDSGYAYDNNEAVLQAFIYNGRAERSLIERVQKGYLVPQGEYLSYAFQWLGKLFGYGEAMWAFEKQMNYRVGDRVGQNTLSPDTPGVLFCLESVSPFGVKKIVQNRERVPFVAHPISHAWFHSPHALWRQQDLMLQVQAVWNKQYIVSAANQATSQVYAPTGAVYEPPIIASGEEWVVREVFIPR